MTTKNIEAQAAALKPRLADAAMPSRRGSHALSPPQEAFAANVARGMNGVEAARTSGYRGSPATLAVTASRLLRTAKVQNRLQQLRDETQTEVSITRAGHLRRLGQLSAQAERAGQLAAAVRAEELVGRACGFYVEKSEFDIAKAAGSLPPDKQLELVRLAVKRIEAITGEYIIKPGSGSAFNGGQ